MSVQSAAGIGLALIGFGLVCVAKAVVDRASARIAAWLIPDHQPTTFRLAWLVVKLAGTIAPARRFLFLGIRRDALGFDYSVVSAEWTSANEATADLEFACRERLRAVQPLKLVLPLLLEAVSLRCVNGKERSAALSCAFVFVLGLLALMPVAIAMGLAELLPELRRGSGARGLLWHLWMTISFCPSFASVIVREALTGRQVLYR
jgi:hypothetical protein